MCCGLLIWICSSVEPLVRLFLRCSPNFFQKCFLPHIISCFFCCLVFDRQFLAYFENIKTRVSFVTYLNANERCKKCCGSHSTAMEDFHARPERFLLYVFVRLLVSPVSSFVLLYCVKFHLYDSTFWINHDDRCHCCHYHRRCHRR